MNDFFILNKPYSFEVNPEFSGFIIFYKKSSVEKDAEIQLNLLNKLIQNALKLSLEQFLLIDLNTQKVRLSDLRKSLVIKKCFLFGVNESEIGTNIVISKYKLNTVAEIQFLKADAPELLEQNKTLKNQLWEQLQIAFNLNS
jgi:hypothetical protein